MQATGSEFKAEWQTASTKANTEFSPWWLALNGELAKRNMPEARYGDARDYYEIRHSSETEADDVVATTA